MRYSHDPEAMGINCGTIRKMMGHMAQWMTYSLTIKKTRCMGHLTTGGLHDYITYMLED
jgi:hypothetical protein